MRQTQQQCLTTKGPGPSQLHGQLPEELLGQLPSHQGMTKATGQQPGGAVNNQEQQQEHCQHLQTPVLDPPRRPRTPNPRPPISKALDCARRMPLTRAAVGPAIADTSTEWMAAA